MYVFAANNGVLFEDFYDNCIWRNCGHLGICFDLELSCWMFFADCRYTSDRECADHDGAVPAGAFGWCASSAGYVGDAAE